MKKYQVGIQEIVYDSIKRGNIMGLPYVTKQQITDDVCKVMKLKNPELQIRQALYQLHKGGKKFSDSKIKKIRTEGNNGKLNYGWTIIDNIEEFQKEKIYISLIDFCHKQLKSS